MLSGSNSNTSVIGADFVNYEMFTSTIWSSMLKYLERNILHSIHVKRVLFITSTFDCVKKWLAQGNFIKTCPNQEQAHCILHNVCLFDKPFYFPACQTANLTDKQPTVLTSHIFS